MVYVTLDYETAFENHDKFEKEEKILELKEDNRIYSYEI